MITEKDRKWLEHCRENAQRFSTCGKRQFYAVILDEHGHQIGQGWNGGPKGFVHCKDGGCPRLSLDSPPGSLYENCMAIHAEANALLHSDYTGRHGATLYVNGPPCFGCAKLIANSGVTRLVFYGDERSLDWPRTEKFLLQANVNTVLVKEES